MNCNPNLRNRIAIEEAFCNLLRDTRTYEEYRKRAGVKKSQLDPLFGLNEFEQLAIWLYSSSLPLHARLNSGLWLRFLAGTKPAREFRIFAMLLNGAIRKLPRFRGIAYRGYGAVKLDHFVSSLSRNSPFVAGAFFSASRVPERAYFGNILFTINSHNGRALGYFSPEPEEEEVLFSPRSLFRVDRIDHQGAKAIIELEEMTR
jgi:hypothetical protein